MMKKASNIVQAVKSKLGFTEIFESSTDSISATAQEIGSLSKQKKKLFRGAIFWYYYREYYFYTFPTAVIIFMILCFTVWNTAEGHLVMGSILSLLSTASVLLSYVMIVPWRKHPSLLILYRSLTSTVFSINIILNAISTSSVNCRNFAVVTQFMLLAGEGWLTTIAKDLVQSLTNPFTSYSANVKMYQIVVWCVTAFIALVFYNDPTCHGEFDHGVCWMSISSAVDPCLWGYYLFWLICMYLYQIWASVFAYFRLRKGLPITFEIRKKCAMETFKCLMTYAIYLSICMLFIACLSSYRTADATSIENFSKFVLFVIANKGTVDGAVWFMLHDFKRDEVNKPFAKKAAESVQGQGGTGERSGAMEELDLREQGIQMQVSSTASGRRPTIGNDVEYVAAQREAIEDRENEEESENEKSAKKAPKLHVKPRTLGEHEEAVKEKMHEMKKKATKTLTEIADLAIMDVDEADLSPQVNLALRQQIVAYVTTGVTDSVRGRSLSRVEPSMFERILGAVGLGWVWRKRDPAVVEGLQVLKFSLEGEHPFTSFAPDLFRELRRNEGITDEHYLKILSAPTNERLSEGASGAFMFFCGGGEFIVKTIRGREARVLHASLGAYSAYLRTNKHSLLCRFLGSYSLAVYSQTFYFVVMRNIFEPSAYINERYDIKGSWVGRSADPGKLSKKSVCRHCNTYFIPSKKEQCSVVIGRHEANVVFKDNDLRTKISLEQNQARNLVDIIMKDSEILGKLGVLDYSLLIGVRKWKFNVELTDEELGINKFNSRQNPRSVPASSTPTSKAAPSLDFGTPASPTPLLLGQSGMVTPHVNRNDLSISSQLTPSPSTTASNYQFTPGGDPLEEDRFPAFKAVSVTGPAVYYLGIVDFLQDWTFMKKVERAFKIYLLRKDPLGLSVMRPVNYKERFQRKIDQLFDIDVTGPPLRRDSANVGPTMRKNSMPSRTAATAASPSPPRMQSIYGKEEASEVVNPLVFAESGSQGKSSSVATGGNVSKSLAAMKQHGNKRPSQSIGDYEEIDIDQLANDDGVLEYEETYPGNTPMKTGDRGAIIGEYKKQMQRQMQQQQSKYPADDSGLDQRMSRATGPKSSDPPRRISSDRDLASSSGSASSVGRIFGSVNPMISGSNVSANGAAAGTASSSSAHVLSANLQRPPPSISDLRPAAVAIGADEEEEDGSDSDLDYNDALV